MYEMSERSEIKRSTNGYKDNMNMRNMKSSCSAFKKLRGMLDKPFNKESSLSHVAEFSPRIRRHDKSSCDID